MTLSLASICNKSLCFKVTTILEFFFVSYRGSCVFTAHFFLKWNVAFAMISDRNTLFSDIICNNAFTVLAITINYINQKITVVTLCIICLIITSLHFSNRLYFYISL
jgi:hypothetical protein